MKTLFIPHWQPYHRDGADRETFAAWNPPMVKIVTNGSDVPYIEDIPAGAGLIVRHYPSSELWGSRGLITPTRAFVDRELAKSDDELLSQYTNGQGSGRDLVRMSAYRTALASSLTRADTPTIEQIADRQVAQSVETASYLRSKGVDLANVWWEGINEPMLWSVEPPELVARLEEQRMIRLIRAGLNPLLFNVGGGWPGNGGVADAPVQWDFAQPCYNRATNKTIFGVHEYWYLNGPQQNYRWWAGRFEQIPWRIPIAITECGIDCGVVPGEAGSGWMRLPEPSLRERARHYIRQDLAWYEDRLIADGRPVAAAIFTHDGVKEDWAGFSTKLSDFVDEFTDWQSGRPDIAPIWPLPTPPEQPEQPVPLEYLPENEPTPSIQKARWWAEEEQRQREAGATERADRIHLSLIRLLRRMEGVA